MSTPVEHAVGLYLDGIRDGRLREALDAHVGDRYVQHSTGVADGRAGFLEFFEPFVAAHPDRDIRIVRTFTDGRYVVVHAVQVLDGVTHWVTMDVFDTDASGRVVEHWDVITPGGRRTAAGHSQTDGPTAVTDLDRTDAHRATVEAYVDVVLVGGATDRTAEFVAALLVEHDPDAGGPATYRRRHRVLAQGNFVAVLAEVDRDGVPHAVVDLFRLADGRVVEHWAAAEPVPTPEVARNGGKF